MGIRHALDLGDDVVRIMRREGDAWTVLQTLPVDDAAFPDNVRDAVGALRGDEGFEAVVFLPRSQVLYTSLDVKDPTRDIVARDLEGLTPYPVKDLEFDFQTSSSGTRVAAVARVTLEETDQFAAACGVCVCGVAANPEPDVFPREPVFAGEFDLAGSEAPETVDKEVEHTKTAAKAVVDAENVQGNETQDDEEPVFSSSAPASPPSRLSERLGRLSLINGTGDSEPRITTGHDLTPPGVPDSSAAEASLTISRAPLAGSDRRLAIPPAPVEPIATRPLGAPDGTLPSGLAQALAERGTTPAQSTQNRLTPARKAIIGLTLATSATTAAVFWIFTYLLPPADTFLQPEDVVVTRALTPREEETSPPSGSDIASLVAPEAETLDVALPNATASEAQVLSTRSIDDVDGLESNDTSPGLEIAIPADAIEPDPEQIADRMFEDATYPDWTIAPAPATSPAQDQIDDLFLAAVDPATPANDAVALPDVLVAGSLPLVQSEPGAPGTTYDLDERGFVRATPEGAITPGGVIVFLGKPSRVPPARPAETLKSATQNGLVLTALARALPPDVVPRPRPENLIELAERKQFGGRSIEELATIRPKARPDELVRRDANAIRVATSLRPKARPGNWAAIVAAIETRDATPAPARTPPAAPAARSPAPAQDVAVASLAPAAVPSVPSNATVRREATLQNAIHLGRVSLIGVYGSPSDRRALIRLPSGRFVKVKVGDRIDGGRVAQIQDGSLSYVKSGRNILLEMPRT